MPANADVIDSIFCYMHIDCTKSGLLSINKLGESSQRGFFCYDASQRIGHSGCIKSGHNSASIAFFYVCRPFQDVWRLC